MWDSSERAQGTYVVLDQESPVSFQMRCWNFLKPIYPLLLFSIIMIWHQGSRMLCGETLFLVANNIEQYFYTMQFLFQKILDLSCLKIRCTLPSCSVAEIDIVALYCEEYKYTSHHNFKSIKHYALKLQVPPTYNFSHFFVHWLLKNIVCFIQTVYK